MFRRPMSRLRYGSEGYYYPGSRNSLKTKQFSYVSYFRCAKLPLFCYTTNISHFFLLKSTI